jgi:DNA repair exonuclease SbcCD ATPase subunit
MRVVSIRLLNFHNFVDETIDVRDGGHLFLLGDNGSGKTTALDAVHYVLSGGQSLELNAAARVGGRRDDGRSIQGVVLRLDAERGVVNDSGAVAYAALELEDAASGNRVSIGIGIEATTMEARVSRWGFVTRRPLADVPLVTDDAGRQFPARRDALRAALGASDVFFRLTDYRAALAARLFGSPAVYDDVCRFWSMGKAYREIVAGSRDFGGLFRRLLPGPDPEVFGDIVRSLRAIGELEVTLREIEQQREYVGGLLALRDEVAALREARARYAWLALFRKRDAAAQELTATQRLAERLGEDIERLTSELAAARARADQADAAVREAEAEDVEGVAAALRSAEGRVAELRGEAAGRRRDARDAERRRANAQRARADATAALSDRADRARAELDATTERATRLPGELPRVRALAAAMAAAPTDVDAWTQPWSSARAEATRAADDGRARVREAHAVAERAGAAADAAACELAALREHAEERPRVAGFDAAIAALDRAGIAARPAYAVAEPRADASAERLAWSESLAGDTALAALVVAEPDRAQARALVSATAPGVRVVVQTSDQIALPAWAEALFEPPADAQAHAALAWLAAAVSQPSPFGAVEVADDRGVLEHRGAAFRPARATPRLLGRAARELAHRARVAAAEAELAAAERELARAREVAGAADEASARADALVAAVEATRARELAELAERAKQLAQSAAFTDELHAAAAERYSDIERRVGDAELRVAALRARADAIDLTELQARIDDLRAVAERCRGAVADLQGRRAVAVDRRGGAVQAARDLDERIALLDRELVAAAERLRANLGGELAAASADLERYVRVTQRGDAFKSVEAIEARSADAERAEIAVTSELAGDGSRGVRNIHFAGRFGFAYDRDANDLTDRRQQPAVGVLADLDRTIAEQRQVITGKTRELMETLVMGSLARDLQRQVDNLDRAIKDINRLLSEIRFGRTRYQFKARPLAERAGLVDIVRSISVLDHDSREQFRTWIDDRLDELRAGEAEAVPELLDYRTWYDFHLRVHTDGGSSGAGTDFKRIRRLGSGGEQGVPNYLLVLALGRLMFENAGAKLHPLLFDEAFYGIDAGRRDQLLRFATELDLQLFVASPDQDGVTPAVRHATTMFIVKDAHGDVHLAPYHYWHRAPDAQRDLFAAEPTAEPAAEDAECRVEGES